jgi:hypothetical protein
MDMAVRIWRCHPFFPNSAATDQPNLSSLPRKNGWHFSDLRRTDVGVAQQPASVLDPLLPGMTPAQEWLPSLRHLSTPSGPIRLPTSTEIPQRLAKLFHYDPWW